MSAQQNKKAVNDFCQAWESLDVEAVLSFMSEDAVYHNVPLKPLAGHEQIRGFFIGLSQRRYPLSF